jgi:hypothetical protein
VIDNESLECSTIAIASQLDQVRFADCRRRRLVRELSYLHYTVMQYDVIALPITCFIPPVIWDSTVNTRVV